MLLLRLNGPTGSEKKGDGLVDEELRDRRDSASTDMAVQQAMLDRICRVRKELATAGNRPDFSTEKLATFTAQLREAELHADQFEFAQAEKLLIGVAEGLLPKNSPPKPKKPVQMPWYWPYLMAGIVPLTSVAWFLLTLQNSRAAVFILLPALVAAQANCIVGSFLLLAIVRVACGNWPSYLSAFHAGFWSAFSLWVLGMDLSVSLELSRSMMLGVLGLIAPLNNLFIFAALIRIGGCRIGIRNAFRVVLIQMLIVATILALYWMLGVF